MATAAESSGRPTDRALPPYHRALTVAGAVLAPVLLWLAAEVLAIELIVDPRNGQPLTVVGVTLVVVFALGSALLGWLTLALLERFTRRALAVWTALALAVLVLSFTPILTAGASLATKLVLAAMHLAVAAVLIPLLPRRGADRLR